MVGLERGKERKTEDYLWFMMKLRYALRYELFQDLSKETTTFRGNEKIRALPMRQYGSFLLGDGLGGAGCPLEWTNPPTYRFLPYDFEIKSKTIEKYGEKKIPNGIPYHTPHRHFRIGESLMNELEPYFDKFEKMAGISGEENPLAGKRSDNKYPTPPMRFHPACMKMFAGCSKKK